MSKNKHLFIGFIFSVFLSLANVAFASEVVLVIEYDEAYQGQVQINGTKIGSLISVDSYDQITQAVQKAKETGQKLDRRDLLKQQTQADDARLDGIATNVQMNLRLEYNLNKYLVPGSNTVTVDFSGYKSPQAEKFAYKSRGVKGPNELKAKIWIVQGGRADLVDYKTHIAKPSEASQYGLDLKQTQQPITFTIQR